VLGRGKLNKSTLTYRIYFYIFLVSVSSLPRAFNQ